jgi:hypothetical protein
MTAGERVRYAFAFYHCGLHAAASVGFLDDLKRQADAAKARETTDVGALERNAALADAACNTAFKYLASLAQQLNVLKPVSKSSYRLDKRHAFDGLRLGDFRADARRKRLRGNEVFDHVVLRYQMKSGQRLSVTKNFLPDIELLESRLRQSGAPMRNDAVRNPETGKLTEMKYEIIADFNASVHVTPDHDSGRLRFELINVEGFETVNVEFPAFEVGNARLDELAKWLMGEANTFLKDGQSLRRVEA